MGSSLPIKLTCTTHDQSPDIVVGGWSAFFEKEDFFPSPPQLKKLEFVLVILQGGFKKKQNMNLAPRNHGELGGAGGGRGGQLHFEQVFEKSPAPPPFFGIHNQTFEKPWFRVFNDGKPVGVSLPSEQSSVM